MSKIFIDKKYKTAACVLTAVLCVLQKAFGSFHGTLLKVDYVLGKR